MKISRYLTDRLRESELNKATGLSTGKLNAWNLPEFESTRQNMLGERDLGMNDYINKMTRTGAEGPAAALGLERYNQGFSNSLLDLANKLQTGYRDTGLSIGKDIMSDRFQQEQNAQNWAKIGLAWQGQHDARRAQGSDFMKTVKDISTVIDTIGKGAELGFGAAGLMGKLPGMNGVSSMAGAGQNSIIQQMIQMLLKLNPGGPSPSGSTWG